MIKQLLKVMRNEDIRKDFGKRLKTLRKQKGWTQKELANKIDIRFPQLNKYECGMHIPPIEVLVRLGATLNITLDYLVTGDVAQIKPLHNTRLMERVKELEQFGNDDQEAIIRMIDAMIVKRRVEGAVLPIDKK